MARVVHDLNLRVREPKGVRGKGPPRGQAPIMEVHICVPSQAQLVKPPLLFAHGLQSLLCRFSILHGGPPAVQSWPRLRAPGTTPTPLCRAGSRICSANVFVAVTRMVYPPASLRTPLDTTHTNSSNDSMVSSSISIAWSAKVSSFLCNCNARSSITSVGSIQPLVLCAQTVNRGVQEQEEHVWSESGPGNDCRKRNYPLKR